MQNGKSGSLRRFFSLSIIGNSENYEIIKFIDWGKTGVFKARKNQFFSIISDFFTYGDISSKYITVFTLFCP